MRKNGRREKRGKMTTRKEKRNWRGEEVMTKNEGEQQGDDCGGGGEGVLEGGKGGKEWGEEGWP